MALSSCVTQRDLSAYSMSGWAVCKDTTVVARVTSTEFELGPRGKSIMEISLSVEDWAKLTDAEDILQYMHQQFPEAKIEVNLDKIQKYE